MRVPTVRITVEGGVATLVSKPKGVRVVIRDYDTDGVVSEESGIKLCKDKNGDTYEQSIWD